MTALPFNVPNTFGNATSNIALSTLDTNFTTITDAINGIGNGATSLTSVTITGGSVGGVTNATVGNAAVGLGNTTTRIGNLTLDNVTITSGNINATIANVATITLGNTVIASGTTATHVGNLTLDNATVTSVSPGGAWTPADASGASLSFSGVSATYQKVGNFVMATGTVTYPATANGAIAFITLPVPVPSTGYAQNPFPLQILSPINPSNQFWGIPIAGASGFQVYQGVANTVLLNSQLGGLTVFFTAIYTAS